LVRGKIELFSLESLVDMATAAGMKVEVRLKKAACAKKCASPQGADPTKSQHHQPT